MFKRRGKMVFIRNNKIVQKWLILDMQGKVLEAVIVYMFPFSCF